MEKYDQISRKRKQLMALEYKYKPDRQLFDSTMGGSGFDTNKVFNSMSEIADFKEEMAQEDISLTKRRDFVVGDHTTTNSKTVGFLDKLMQPFGDELYRNAMEMADGELDLVQGIKELIIVQYHRLLMGIEYEQEVGLGNNPETEACRAGLESLYKTANELIYGKKIDIHAEHHHALTDEIMGIDLKEDYIDVRSDIDDFDYSE